MVQKKKHSKQLKKLRQQKEATKKHEAEIDFDTSAYVVYNRLEMTYPCLSFDIITDDQPGGMDRVKNFPLSMYLVAGAQTPPHVDNNYIYVMKIDDIKPLKQEDENQDDDEKSDESDGEGDTENLPKLNSLRVAHKGCVNRIRANRMHGKTFVASWSDKGKVNIFDLTTPLQAVSDAKSMKTYVAQKYEPKPTYTFGGHLSEGYALDWAPLTLGSLATGDCKKNIHIWKLRSQSDWLVDQQPLVGHESSVEDIKWSPEDSNVLASCSVDKSVRIWDLRHNASDRCVECISNSHSSDVNVIDWNKRTKNLLVSGGDDGIVKVWDLRYIKRSQQDGPVAHFDYHKKSITSLEWNPNDDTVMAVSSDDDKITLWDLAVEKDEEQEEADAEAMEVDSKKKDDNGDKKEDSSDESNSEDNSDDDEEMDEENEDIDGVEYGDLKKIPEQMLFLHMGQNEIKELHWHPQLNGLLISTALNGLNIFKTVSA